MLDKKITYSIYLLKDDFVASGEYLQNTSDCEYFSIPISGYSDADLYIKTRSSRNHNWSRLLPTEISGVDWHKYKSRSFFGLLLIEVNDRVFALTSGFGRYLLHPFSIENRFGFKAVLNSVDPKTIQQLSKTTLSDNPKRSIEQVTKGINIGQFGIDEFTDLIQRIKGKSKIENLGLSLDGEDALKISVAHELEQLPGLLKECLSFYASEEYKNYFPEIDNLAKVKDKQQKAALDSELESKFHSELSLAEAGEELSGDVWASIPEIVFDEDFDCYLYKNSNEALRHYDIELKHLFKERYFEKDGTKKKDVTISSLTRDKIFIRKVDDTIYPKWRTLQCINAIIEHGQDKYFFLEGKWFRASATYIDALDQKIEGIPSSDLIFVDWPQQVPEKEYLESLPLTSKNNYLVLDRDNIYIEGQKPIEPCDLYTEDKILIHLKRYGSSSVLGHLFNQGFVSGDLLLNSIEFKEKFNKKLNGQYKFNEVNPSNFTIGYVIGTKYPEDLKLPLFSKITLVKAYDELRKKGFNVTLDICKITPI